MQLRSILILILLAVFTAGYGQETITIKGQVKNSEGEVLSGATVSVSGAKLYTTTKKDGTFELPGVRAGNTIRVTFVGHSLKEIKIAANQGVLSVVLKRNVNTLDEVVVNTGLYQRPTANFTGAAKTYSGDQLRQVNPVNVLQALAVMEPSFRIVENNLVGSDPNQLPVIQLRGQNNLPVNTQGGEGAMANVVSNGDVMSSYLLNPNQPLIIIDGFQSTLQVLHEMDINRIANITVLKDAAATVAYGSKAANGVIVVETKQPQAGRLQVTYAFNAGVELADLSSYRLLNAGNFLEAQRLAGIYNDPNNNYKDASLQQWYNYRLAQVQKGVNTYWLSQPLRTGLSLNNSVTLQGGTRNLRFSLSLNYNKIQGVMKGSENKSYGLNYYLAYNLKNIRFSNITTVSASRADNSPWGTFSDYTRQFPYFRPYDSIGNIIKIFEPSAAELGFYTQAPGGMMTNAMYNSTLNVEDYSKSVAFSNATNFDWSITRGLRFKANFRFSRNLPEGIRFLPADHTEFSGSFLSAFTDLGSYSQLKGKNSAVDGRVSFDYNTRIGKHVIFSSLGFTAQQTLSSSESIKTTGIPIDYLSELGLANGYGNSIKPAAINATTRSVSQYLSVGYNYNERYTAEFTLNNSGSSQFGANNRLAPFWGGGVSWNVHKEKFFRSNAVIQQLRIRASTGITGNQNFAASMAQPYYNYNLYNNYRIQLGADLSNYANPNLKWQQTLKNNLGVQMSLFDERLVISGDLYSEKTNNLILPLDVAPSTGFVSYQDNLGAVENRGYEVSVSVPVIRNRARNINWIVTLNAGHYDNIITKLSPAIEALNAENNKQDDIAKQQKPLPRFVVGQSMSTIWAVRSLGIDPATGREVFQKLDGSRTFKWDPVDKVPAGIGDSKVKGMLGSNFNYKSFVFNFNLAYAFGGWMYNQTLADKIENVNLNFTNADERVFTERWKKPGDQSSYKALISNAGSSVTLVTNSTTRFVQRNNYIEASNITVGYNFPANTPWVKKLKLSAPRLYVTQNNLFRVGTIKTERGTAYPFSRRFNIGLSSSF